MTTPKAGKRGLNGFSFYIYKAHQTMGFVVINTGYSLVIPAQAHRRESMP
jgi:hypothetical protein